VGVADGHGEKEKTNRKDTNMVNKLKRVKTRVLRTDERKPRHSFSFTPRSVRTRTLSAAASSATGKASKNMSDTPVCVGESTS
jgi:hypothetical protein